MKIATIEEVKARLGVLLKASERDPVVVTRRGRPIAVIVGVQNEDDVERLLMAHSPHLAAILEKSRKQFREGHWLGEKEFWSQFGLPKARGGAQGKAKQTMKWLR